MQSQLRAIAGILFAVALYLVGNGLIGVVIPVRAQLEGFSTLALGIIGSAYFAGFIGGCLAGPRLIARVGHTRTFAIGAGLSSAATLAQAMLVTEPVWILMRAGFGFAAACIYMVIESWLNDRATNETRGRIFAAYLTVNFSSLIAGQMLFGTSRPDGFGLFALCAICYGLCLIPMGLTRLPQPEAGGPVPQLRPARLYRIAPVGVAGCIAVGFANSALWTLAPVFAQSHGLAKGWIAVFMSVFTFGGAIVQVPLGRISDRTDRRIVIASVCTLASALGVVMFLFGGKTLPVTLLLMGLFGIVVLPVYGLSVAHTNDRMPRAEFVEASASLLLINSLCSVVGPTLAALVIGRFGTASLFLYSAAVHLAMAVFTVTRIVVREAPMPRQHYEPLPPQATPAVTALDPRVADTDEAALS